jgi:hypothetical protein
LRIFESQSGFTLEEIAYLPNRPGHFIAIGGMMKRRSISHRLPSGMQ